MGAGGLFDHLGGGFFRYCVDQQWQIPHFEKMLYDNAALLRSYADAFAATGDREYGRIANMTADWVRTEMRSPEGGFYATLDADSEGEEGRYYVFQPDEFDASLEADSDFAKTFFGLNAAANFEESAWHVQAASLDRYRELDENAAQTLGSIRERLLKAREQRVRPERDDKILTAWNGLMIGALARAARHMDRPDLLSAAREATDFIRENLWQGGRLLATWKDGRARYAGYLDDYAFLLDGLIELMQADFRADELEFAIELAEAVMAHFSDPAGGWFFTAADHEQLIHRPKPLADDAVPAGNGKMTLALTTLGHFLAEPRYLDAAERSLLAAWPAISQYPDAHATYLLALARHVSPPSLIVVSADTAALDPWRAELHATFAPDRLAFLIPGDEPLPSVLERFAGAGPGAAYLCEGLSCSAPIESADALRAALGADTDTTAGQ